MDYIGHHKFQDSFGHLFNKNMGVLLQIQFSLAGSAWEFSIDNFFYLDSKCRRLLSNIFGNLTFWTYCLNAKCKTPFCFELT